MLDFFPDEVFKRSQPSTDDELRECRLWVGGQFQRWTKPCWFMQPCAPRVGPVLIFTGGSFPREGVSSHSHSRWLKGAVLLPTFNMIRDIPAAWLKKEYPAIARRQKVILCLAQLR
jgi:hypothetical protein